MAPFTAQELAAVLAKLRTGKAPGIDLIPAEMLQHLGPAGEAYLLHLANRSWRHAEVPHPWRAAEIVPVFKGKGKDPTRRKSYRPISLTSVVSKVVERLIKTRVQDHLERSGLLAPEQAGYRAARSCEEHCVRLTQFIHDGLARKHGTVLLSVDATAAFDRMLKARLYEKMRRKGLPEPVVAWFAAFLTDRKARVRVDHATSSFRTFKEGCPQGTVLGPLCWLLFIDDLRESLRELGAELFMYADDVCLAFQGASLKDQYARAQRALDVLRPWAAANAVEVSLEKTCATAFAHRTPREKEAGGAAQYPGLRFGDVPVKYEKDVRFLGLWLDEDFTFARHTAELKERYDARLPILKSLAGASWGCKRKTLRTVYLAIVQSCADYALPAYAPYAAGSEGLKELAKTEKEAAMLIGGCVSRSRKIAIYGEAGLRPIDSRAKTASANMYERLLRLPEDNPARAMAERPDPVPLVKRGVAARPGWRSTARREVTAAGLDGIPRAPLPLFARADAAAPAGRPPAFHPFLCEKVSRHDPAKRRKDAALRTLARLPPASVHVYTDGSVLRPDASRDGGSGYVATDAAGAQHRGRAPAGRLCSSYVAEMGALRLALRDIAAAGTPFAVPCGAEIRFHTDSQSAVRRLRRGPWAQTDQLGQDVWAALQEAQRRHLAHVTVQYVPGHAGLDGNELADEEAKEAAKDARAAGAEDPPAVLPLAKSVLRAHDRQRQRAEVEEKGGAWWDATEGRPPRWPRGLRRGQERVIAQLRAGKCPITAEYQHLCGWKPSPACACGAPVESVAHLLLHCPLHEKARLRMETPECGRSLTLLSREPERVLRYLRDIGREGCATANRAAYRAEIAREREREKGAAGAAAAAAAGGKTPVAPFNKKPNKQTITITHPPTAAGAPGLGTLP